MGHVLSFERITQSQHLICIFNLSNEKTNMTMPEGIWNVYKSHSSITDRELQKKLTLASWSYVIAELKKE